MSRSYKKHSFDSWYSSKSMKAWRTQENRRLRHNAKQRINVCLDYDGLIIPVLNDFDTLWGSPQDGTKHYVEKPLINNCEWDAHTWHHSWGRHRRNVNALGHHESCNCYTNKKGWYWKNMRK